jgi:hypothetical protein
MRHVYIYIQRIVSTYLLSRNAHVYIYNQACAMSKYTLIYAHMSTFKFPACADLYISICGIYTCIHVHIYIYIHQAHMSIVTCHASAQCTYLY